jgi:hypothetical protein
MEEVSKLPIKNKKEKINDKHRWQALLAAVITATLIIGPILFLLLR